MTRWILAAVAALGLVGGGVYVAVSAQTTPGATVDTAALEALREGSMQKLLFHSAPQDAGTTAFVDVDGTEKTLADYRGQHVLVNFWATWCAPCRHEMPSLDRLNVHFDGQPFTVVTIATGRNAPEGIAAFFDEVGVASLPQYRDDGGHLAREMGVFGLPMSMILDPEGREIARLRGDAEWDTDSAKAIVAALIAGEAG